jgi:hypothetical protein
MRETVPTQAVQPNNQDDLFRALEWLHAGNPLNDTGAQSYVMPQGSPPHYNAFQNTASTEEVHEGHRRKRARTSKN